MIESQNESGAGRTAARRRRVRRDASQWRALIEQQQISGQSVKAFCAEHGLGQASFYGWRRHLRQQTGPHTEAPSQDRKQERPPAADSTGFVRLDPEGGASSEMIEVQFACGTTLRCGSSHLAELVRTLKADKDGHR